MENNISVDFVFFFAMDLLWPIIAVMKITSKWNLNWPYIWVKLFCFAVEMHAKGKKVV